MQRYRVNYRLLAILIISAFVAAPAAYGLWHFQVDRNANRLLQQADVAEEKSEYSDAYDSLSQYVKLRKQDYSALLRLGQVALKLSGQDDLDIRKRSEAYFIIINAVQTCNKPDIDEQLSEQDRAGVRKLQRDLVDLHLRYAYADRALQTIEEIIKAGRGDDDLMALKAQCLFSTQETGKAVDWCYKVIGYDQKADTFDASKGLAPTQPRVYALLAQYLLTSGQKDLAKRTVDQLVVANPESVDAYVIRFQVLSMLDKRDEAREAIEKAYKLDPKDASVLQSKGTVAIDDYQEALAKADEALAEAEKPENAARAAQIRQDAAQMRKDAEKHLDEAGGYFAQGLQNYPDVIAFYRQAAQIELFRQRVDEALRFIEQGLTQFDLLKRTNVVGYPLAMELENQKLDILFNKKDFDAVRAEIKKLRELQNQSVQAIADFHETRIEMMDHNWLDAARRFNDIKFRLAGNALLQAIASFYQGQCHDQLGQIDLAIKAYEWGLEKNPKLAPAQYALDEDRRKSGQQNAGDDTALDFQKIVEDVNNKPPEQQDWAALEVKIDEYVKKQG